MMKQGILPPGQSLPRHPTPTHDASASADINADESDGTGSESDDWAEYTSLPGTLLSYADWKALYPSFVSDLSRSKSAVYGFRSSDGSFEACSPAQTFDFPPDDSVKEYASWSARRFQESASRGAA